MEVQHLLPPLLRALANETFHLMWWGCFLRFCLMQTFGTRGFYGFSNVRLLPASLCPIAVRRLQRGVAGTGIHSRTKLPGPGFQGRRAELSGTLPNFGADTITLLLGHSIHDLRATHLQRIVSQNTVASAT